MTSLKDQTDLPSDDEELIIDPSDFPGVRFAGDPEVDDDDTDFGYLLDDPVPEDPKPDSSAELIPDEQGLSADDVAKDVALARLTLAEWLCSLPPEKRLDVVFALARKGGSALITGNYRQRAEVQPRKHDPAVVRAAWACLQRHVQNLTEEQAGIFASQVGRMVGVDVSRSKYGVEDRTRHQR